MESNSYGMGYEKMMMQEMAENGPRIPFNQGLGIQKAMSLPANTSQFYATLQGQA